MPRKKRKIIEVDRRRFKEVRKDEEPEIESEEFEEGEESLEQELEVGDDFVEFLSGEGGGEISAPVLESIEGQQVVEPIEDALQDVQTPGQAAERGGAEGMRPDYEEAAVYNLPDYDAGIYAAEMEVEDIKRREPERVPLHLIRPDEALVSDTMRPVRMRPEEGMATHQQGEGGPEDYVMREMQREQEDGLPGPISRNKKKLI